ncbi:uncharacterized protein LOC142570595 [Dermacentor variabilis]|uniref:uncharacterized protein LOC142570595 n=1 Tax=Dermacentor variabilis TaxID=34621 RepID=UPI003F5B90F7
MTLKKKNKLFKYSNAAKAALVFLHLYWTMLTSETNMEPSRRSHHPKAARPPLVSAETTSRHHGCAPAHQALHRATSKCAPTLVFCPVIAAAVTGAAIFLQYLKAPTDTDSTHTAPHSYSTAMEAMLQMLWLTGNNTLDPCKDFYEYACYNFYVVHKESAYFNDLETPSLVLQGLSSNEAGRALFTYYRSCLLTEWNPTRIVKDTVGALLGVLYASGDMTPLQMFILVSLASCQAVTTRFTEHFVHPANELCESSRFHRRVQLPDESADTYYAELRRMVKRCNYPPAAVEERLVRDRFIVGLRDSRLSDQLCRNAKLALQDAWTQARQSEDADMGKALPQNRTEHTREHNLDATKPNKLPSRCRSGAKPRSPQPQAERSREPSTCDFCGRAPHRRSDCPARRSACNFCKKKGHFAEVCRSQTFKQEKLSSVHLHAVGTPAAAKFVDVTVDDYTAQFEVDSGAEVSAVPTTFIRCPTNSTKSSLCSLAREDSHCACWARIWDDFGGKGKQSASKATLHAQLFNGLGTLKDKYNIRLKPDALPFSLSVPRRIPIPLLEIARRELDKLESAGVIRRVDKPTPWCSGLVVVRKGDGSYRLCVDFTQLNKVVLLDRHILQTVEQVLGLLGDATVFSKLDATESFHHVKLSKNSQVLTTFIPPYGRYCFCRLPFGITSAPEYFQKQMERILEGQEEVANMIDDTLVFGRTCQEHDARLSQELSRLAKAGITLNQEKCRFGVPDVSFLGVVVSVQVIRPDPGEVEAVKAMQAATDIAGVRRLLGMVNHLARFLPHISDVRAPIRALLNKSASWQHERKAAFEKIEEILTPDRCMAKCNPSYATTASADASSFGLGANLLQTQPSGERRPVTFASKSMTETEQRYSQTEKGALATT